MLELEIMTNVVGSPRLLPNALTSLPAHWRPTDLKNCSQVEGPLEADWHSRTLEPMDPRQSSEDPQTSNYQKGHPSAAFIKLTGYELRQEGWHKARQVACLGTFNFTRPC